MRKNLVGPVLSQWVLNYTDKDNNDGVYMDNLRKVIVSNEVWDAEKGEQVELQDKKGLFHSWDKDTQLGGTVGIVEFEDGDGSVELIPIHKITFVKETEPQEPELDYPIRLREFAELQDLSYNSVRLSCVRGELNYTINPYMVIDGEKTRAFIIKNQQLEDEGYIVVLDHRKDPKGASWVFKNDALGKECAGQFRRTVSEEPEDLQNEED